MDRLPGFMLADSPWKLDPAKCRHHIKQFIGTEFLDPRRGKHQINQLFRCQDCGKVERIPRTVREAGKYGSIDPEDPRVFRTLRVNNDTARRYFKE